MRLCRFARDVDPGGAWVGLSGWDGDGWWFVGSGVGWAVEVRGN